MQPEPVSPELALVDPELAARERARLNEKARLAELLDAWHPHRPAERATELPAFVERVAAPKEPVRSLRTAFVTAALLCSMLGNGILTAFLVLRADGDRQVAAAPAALTLSAPSTVAATAVTTVERTATGVVVPSVTRSRGSATTAPVARTSRLPNKSVVERKLASLIVRAPRRLPRIFIDPTTGLVKNNVRVTCKQAREKNTRSYLCAVRLPHKSGRVVVAYRSQRSGIGLFTWYGYRR